MVKKKQRKEESTCNELPQLIPKIRKRSGTLHLPQNEMHQVNTVESFRQVFLFKMKISNCIKIMKLIFRGQKQLPK